MSVRLSFALVAAALSGSSAFAQTTPPPRPQVLPPQERTIRIPDQINGGLTRQAVLYRAQRESQEAELAQRNREGMERAERLAALVNQGQCRTAYDTAIAENDPMMARKIHQACSNPQANITVTDPEPVE